MKQYILHTIDGALSGDMSAIFKCVVFAFLIHFVYSKILDILAERGFRKSKLKDMTKSPSQSKLMDRGYSIAVDPPTRPKTVTTTRTRHV